MPARCQPATGAPHTIHLYATSRSSRGQGRPRSCSAQSTGLSKQNSCSAQGEVFRRSTPSVAVILATVQTTTVKSGGAQGPPGQGHPWEPPPRARTQAEAAAQYWQLHGGHSCMLLPDCRVSALSWSYRKRQSSFPHQQGPRT